LTKRPIKISITGTHSTGKSTFLDKLEAALRAGGLVVERFGSLALEARGLGFPIDSTLWIIGECIRREASATLRGDVILIDRPVSDALGYLEAALEVSGRSVEPQRLHTIRAIALDYMKEYDVIIETLLDTSVPLGPGRDTDTVLR
jgi:predicted ATPase